MTGRQSHRFICFQTKTKTAAHHINLCHSSCHYELTTLWMECASKTQTLLLFHFHLISSNSSKHYTDRHANNVIQKARELRDSGVPVPEFFLSPKASSVVKNQNVSGTSAPKSQMKSSNSFTSGSPSPYLMSRRSLGSIQIPPSIMTKMTMQQRLTGTTTTTGSTMMMGAKGKLSVTTEKKMMMKEKEGATMTASSQSCRNSSSVLNDSNQKDQQHQLMSLDEQLQQGLNFQDRRVANTGIINDDDDVRKEQLSQHPNEPISNDLMISNRGGSSSCYNINNNNNINSNNKNNVSSSSCYQVPYKKNARAGTFHARDNVCNFITWCRSLNIRECLLFETEDLVLGKNEKSFILCLLEVARKGSMLGMTIPMLIQLEQEIDQEIESDERQEKEDQVDHHQDGSHKKPGLKSITRIPILKSASGSRIEDVDEDEDDAKHVAAEQNDSQYNSETDSDTSSTIQPQIITNDLKSLHEHVVDLLNRCTCPSQYPMIKVSDGKYKIGDTKTLIFVRILRRHVMVRVGGGWDTLEHYLDKHDPCRCYYAIGGGRRRSSAGLNSSGGSFNLKNVRV